MKVSAFFVVAFLLLPSVHSPASDLADAATSWPGFPAPSEVLSQPEEHDFAARVLQQTAAGLTANHAR